MNFIMEMYFNYFPVEHSNCALTTLETLLYLCIEYRKHEFLFLTSFLRQTLDLSLR
jgi:hypothetical protein